MVVSIKKEDIVGAVKTTAAIGTSATPSNDFDKVMSALDKVNTLLANPTINQLVMRVASRYGLGQTANADRPNIPPEQRGITNPITPPVPIINMNPVPVLNPEKIYSSIAGALDMVMLAKGDMPLSEAKKEIVAQKELILKLIADAIKP